MITIPSDEGFELVTDYAIEHGFLLVKHTEFDYSLRHGERCYHIYPSKGYMQTQDGRFKIGIASFLHAIRCAEKHIGGYYG